MIAYVTCDEAVYNPPVHLTLLEAQGPANVNHAEGSGEYLGFLCVLCRASPVLPRTPVQGESIFRFRFNRNPSVSSRGAPDCVPPTAEGLFHMWVNMYLLVCAHVVVLVLAFFWLLPYRCRRFP